jgi:hypothetical protein
MSSKTFLVGRSSIGLTILMILILMIASREQSLAQGTGDGVPDDGYANPQGTELQALPPGFEGFYVDAKSSWSHRGVALGGVAVVEGELVVAGPGRRATTDLAGTTFAATLVDGSTVPMRIARVVRHQNPWNGPRPQPRQSDYVIEYSSDGQWASLCSSDPPGAIPVAGSFGHTPEGHPNGAYDPAPTRLTFSCRDGVAAKCQDWGYRSWDPERGRYFQACTRMARADYCGNGHSRTVDGTMINYVDLHGQPLVLRPLPGFVPEAVWGPGGAGDPTAAICLSRTRWSTIPIGPRSPCAELDPRAEAPTDRKPGQFCEDKTPKDWANEGALFVNNSRPLDVGLFVWRDENGHFMTTTKFPWLGKGVTSPSPPGYPVFVSIEGSAYKPKLPAPKKSRLVPLYRYTKKAGAITLALSTTGPTGDGFRDPVLEAYVLEFKPPFEPPTRPRGPRGRGSARTRRRGETALRLGSRRVAAPGTWSAVLRGG